MMGNSLLFAFGVVILLLLTFDLFKTVVQSSEGMISRGLQVFVHRLLFMLFQSTKSRKFLVWSSSFLILSLLFTWLTLLYVGWLLIFSSSEQAVIINNGNIPATFMERVYFTGFTISTLGIGDMIPGAPFWQFMTVMASLSGFFLLTFIVSFLISIAQKQSLRRRLALRIHYIGKTPQQMVVDHCGTSQTYALDDALQSLLSDLIQFRQEQSSQPILNRLYESLEAQSIELALVSLDEALTLTECLVEISRTPTITRVRSVLTDYLYSFDQLPLPPADEVPTIPDMTTLSDKCGPLKSAVTIESYYKSLAGRRSRLLSLLRSAGWEWEQVIN